MHFTYFEDASPLILSILVVSQLPVCVGRGGGGGGRGEWEGGKAREGEEKERKKGEQNSTVSITH